MLLCLCVENILFLESGVSIIICPGQLQSSDFRNVTRFCGVVALLQNFAVLVEQAAVLVSS